MMKFKILIIEYFPINTYTWKKDKFFKFIINFIANEGNICAGSPQLYPSTMLSFPVDKRCNALQILETNPI